MKIGKTKPNKTEQKKIKSAPTTALTKTKQQNGLKREKDISLDELKREQKKGQR